ncbi:MAG: hypothetical protein H0X04_00120 [Chthoniobacterales bacterium]|nr:hypothetical protein [Chthoniobacterales bacterium]
MTHTLKRRFDFTEAKLNKEKGIVENVHILGLKSANGYTYLEAAAQKALPKYEDASIYLNHSKEARKVEDKFGFVSKPRFVEGKGIYGDVHYNTAHSYAPAFAWWVENNSSQVGMSHSVGVQFDERTKTVTAIEDVNSVDLVSDPATVKGLFESIQPNLPAQEVENIMDLAELKSKHADLVAKIAEEAIAKLLADEAKLAEALKDIKSEDRSEVFVESVRAALGDSDKVRKLVEDRKALIAARVPAAESTEIGKGDKKPVKEEKKALTESDLAAAFGVKLEAK